MRGSIGEGWQKLPLEEKPDLLHILDSLFKVVYAGVRVDDNISAEPANTGLIPAEGVEINYKDNELGEVNVSGAKIQVKERVIEIASVISDQQHDELYDITLTTERPHFIKGRWYKESRFRALGRVITVSHIPSDDKMGIMGGTWQEFDSVDCIQNKNDYDSMAEDILRSMQAKVIIAAATA